VTDGDLCRQFLKDLGFQDLKRVGFAEDGDDLALFHWRIPRGPIRAVCSAGKRLDKPIGAL
jgi:hypothetical protein